MRPRRRTTMTPRPAWAQPAAPTWSSMSKSAPNSHSTSSTPAAAMTTASSGLEPELAAGQHRGRRRGQAADRDRGDEQGRPREVLGGDEREGGDEQRAEGEHRPDLTPGSGEPRQQVLVPRGGGRGDRAAGEEHQEHGERARCRPTWSARPATTRGRARPTTSGPAPRTTYAWTRAPRPHQAISCGSYAGTCRLWAACMTTAPNVRAARIRTQPTTGDGMSPPDDPCSRRPASSLAAHEEGQPEGGDHGEPDQRRELVEVAGDQPEDADADEGGAEGQQQAREVEAPGRVVARQDRGGGPVVDEAGRSPERELGGQPVELGGGGRPGPGGQRRCRRCGHVPMVDPAARHARA